MQTSTSFARKLVIGLACGAGLIFAMSTTTACSVTVTANCGAGFTDCGGVCADLADDPGNCGGCGIDCGPDECISGQCTTIACVADNDPCTVDGDCCSLFCATDGACGCILNGDTSTFCSADIDCCSDNCDTASGFCQ